MTEPVQINVLGGFRLCVGEHEVSVLPRKVRALLAYLALQRGRPVIREAVGELLWSDRGSEQTRHSLRQALGVLRRHIPGSNLIVSQDGTLKLSERARCDATSVLELSPSSDPTAADIAISAYSGPLLKDFPPISHDFDGWLLSMRGQLENLVLEALDNLISRYSSAGNTTDALIAAERMFAIDPMREDIHRRLIEAYAAAGRRSEALRRYGTVVELLRRELDVAPSRETRELAHRIRGEMDSPRDGSVATVLPVWAEPTSTSGAPIAVLPFKQIGADHLPSHLAEGLTTDIIYQLAGLRELSVISHGTTSGLTDTSIDLRTVGRMLGVRYVVRGSIRSLGPHVRLTTELTDVESGLMVWGRSLDATRSMSFEDQDRMVALLVNALAPRVHEIELRRIRGKRPETLAVYEKVLLAREHLLNLGHEDLLAARRLLEEVIAVEPAYAESYALLSNWHSLMIGQGWSKDRQADIASVEQMAQQALSLDGDNVRALVLYAHRRSLLHRDYQAAYEMFEHALKIMPSSAFAWVWSSFTCSYRGDADEAFHRASRAMELSPRDREAHIFLSAFCVANYVLGNYKESADWGLRAIGEKFALGSLYRYVSAALAASGSIGHAREIARKGMKVMPNERVSDIVRNSALYAETQRQEFGRHLVSAGYPQ